MFGVGVAAGLGLAGWGLVPPPAAPVPTTTFDHRAAEAVAIGPSTPTSDPTPDPVVLEPARLRIPALGVDAAVRAESVTATGELVVPGDPAVLGSWTAGEAGEASAAPDGVLVIAGHVDMRGDLGALHDLAEVSPGTQIDLVGAGGGVEHWRVDALEVRGKDDLPDFSATGPRRLAVVTCGGPVVDTATGRGYRDNVIAWATPAR